MQAKKIDFLVRDVAQDEDAKTLMKKLCPEGRRIPIIVNGELFCGDFEAFEEAVEYDELHQFLKL